MDRRWRRRRSCGCSWWHDGIEELVDGVICIDGGDVFSVKGAGFFERREGWVGFSRGEGDLEALAEDFFGYGEPQVDVGLAGCEPFLLGGVDFTRFGPLFVLFFEEGALACKYCVEGVHVCFYNGWIFCLRHGREHGHGAGEGDLSFAV